MTNFYIERQRQTKKHYLENLGNGIKLDMVLIPEGKFIMGTPESEQDSNDSERPQHEVTVSTFFMGRYLVTQEQWRTIMGNNPSRFKGDKRPIERVSWNDAKQFCAQLSEKTPRRYRLPTEAEWEYACRAGTSTPFHFGKTITTELANYRGTDNKEYQWSGSYGKGPKGEYREETTPVDKFGNANDFGLCDMHGNVWESCEDTWHSDYKNAPRDGSAWVDEKSNLKVLRGGSWNDNPFVCRSASRNVINPRLDLNRLGFRVVCVVTSVNS